MHTPWDILFPKRCMGCGIYDRYICSSCWEEKIRPYESWQYKTNPLWAFYYANPLGRSLIEELKYRHATQIVAELGERMAEILISLYQRVPQFLIIPIPLSKQKLRLRGFNQAELLAYSIAQKTHLMLNIGILERMRHVPSQTLFHNHDARRKNVKGEFRITPNAKEAMRGRKILLIDDVSTSGATLDEATATLKAAGAKQILGLVAAKG